MEQIVDELLDALQLIGQTLFTMVAVIFMYWFLIQQKLVLLLNLWKNPLTNGS